MLHVKEKMLRELVASLRKAERGLFHILIFFLVHSHFIGGEVLFHKSFAPSSCRLDITPVYIRHISLQI